MSSPRRATVYFDPAVHRALRRKAAQTDHSLSELVNAAVERSLDEDAEDLEAFDSRKEEPNLKFADVLKDLKRRGKI